MLKKKFLFGGIIIVLAIAYLAYSGFQSSASYYYTVNEVIDRGTSLNGEKLRVSGKVLAGSVQKEAGGLELKFSLGDADKNLPVVYRGAAPDTFKPDSEIVVEGKLDASGVLQSTGIVNKCPSKYAPSSNPPG